MILHNLQYSVPDVPCKEGKFSLTTLKDTIYKNIIMLRLTGFN